ncbi:MAG: hypothetical protein Hens3KO_19400 [Henriciella sp.]
MGTRLAKEIQRISSFWDACFGLSEDVSSTLFWRFFWGVLALASLLRFWNLDAVGLSTDEAITYQHSQLPLHTILFGNIDYHPPLGPALQWAWSSLFPDPALARVPHAALGVLTVAALILFLRDFVSRRAALVAGALLAVMTGHIYFSQEVRMYALLVFGLVLAAWGAVGFTGRGQFKQAVYAGLYIAGGLVMIGAHDIGLILMGLVGLVGLAAWRDAVKVQSAFYTFFVANLGLLILAGPWILHILMAAGSHPGLTTNSITLLPWYIGNMAGFPGLGGAAKLFELLMIGIALIGIMAAWKGQRRTLAVLLFVLVIVFPILLAGLHLYQPVLANRVILPIAIGFSAAFGVGVMYIKSGRVRHLVTVVLLAAGLISSVNELAYRQKWDDPRGAVAFAVSNEFASAPLLVCRNYTGATLVHEAPGSQIFFYHDGDVLEQSKPGYWKIAAIPISQLSHLSAREIDTWLGGGYVLANGLNEVFSGTDKIAFIRRFCDPESDKEIAAALDAAGFQQKIHARIRPAPENPVFLVYPMSQVTLYQRDEQAP